LTHRPFDHITNSPVTIDLLTAVIGELANGQTVTGEAINGSTSQLLNWSVGKLVNNQQVNRSNVQLVKWLTGELANWSTV